jgi:DNA-binding MarR family transcriptional regulator
MAGTDAMSTSKALRLLEKKQLIQRLSNPQDARAHMLSPTDTGYSLLYQAMPLVEQADEAYFSPLDAAQRQAFLRSLTALQAAASDDLS